MQFLGGESKILSHVKFIQIISTLGFQETSAQRTNGHQEQEPAHVLHGEARMYMRACLTPESLLLTVLLVFHSQLAYYYISRLKENTAQAAGIIILIKNPHKYWSESPHRTDALQDHMGFHWSLENPPGFCGQSALPFSVSFSNFYVSQPDLIPISPASPWEHTGSLPVCRFVFFGKWTANKA